MPSQPVIVSGSVRAAVRVVALLGVLGLVACVAHANFGSPGAHDWLTTYVYPFLFLPAAALCLLRGWVVRAERLTWTLVGLGYLLWTAGFLYYNLRAAGAQPAPMTSLADAGSLAFYPLVFCGLVVLLRSRATSLASGVGIDGLIGALALASLAAAVLVHPIVAAVGGDAVAAVTLLAYPVGTSC